MRYDNPTPNPLPASNEGAMMYLITKESAVSFRCPKTTNSSTLLIKASKNGVIVKNRHKNPHKSLNNRVERFINKKEMAILC
jgi:hypothetical protein